jgi:hypothetical protein
MNPNLAQPFLNNMSNPNLAQMMMSNPMMAQ